MTLNESQPIPMQAPPRRQTTVLVLLWALIIVFAAVRFVHLAADFPNDTPWASDQAKFTDEGWWASSAVNHHLSGHWTIPGDYNPAAAVPLWTAILSPIFSLTGISLIVARTLSVVFSLASILLLYLLLRRSTRATGQVASRYSATMAALLLASSPFAFSFARLAILDSCVLCQFCLLLLVASSLSPQRPWPGLLVLATLVALLVLTKTTAILLLPAVAWLALSALGISLPSVFSVLATGTVLPGILLASWYTIVRSTGHLIDLNYFFEVNGMDPFNPHTLPQTLLDLVQNGLWIDPVLLPLAACFVFLACFPLRSLWRNPLFSSSLVALLCQSVYLIRRQDDTAPRYFLPLLIPIILIVVLGLEALWTAARVSGRRGWASQTVTAVLGLTVVWHGLTIANYVSHPTFAYIGALNDIRRIVDSDCQQRRLVLGISAADLSLATGIPSLNDAFGSDDLSEKVARLQPGWFLAWNGVGDDIHAALPQQDFLPVAQYAVFDDADRSTLILYRLSPRPQTPQPALH